MNKSSQTPRPVIFFKIATLLIAAFVMLGSGLTVVSHSLITKDLRNQEKLETEYLVERGHNALKSRQETLHALTDRLAQSKALHALLAASTDYSDSIDVDFIGLKERTNNRLYDFILFFDEKGHLTHKDAVAIVTGQGLRNAQATVQEVEQLAEQLRERLVADMLSSMAGFFLPESEVPVLLAAAPVLPAKDPNGSAGLLILGCYIDHALIRAINTKNKLTMRVNPANNMHSLVASEQNRDFFVPHGKDILVAPVDDYTNAGYALLSDLLDKPTLVLEVIRNRTIFQNGMALWRQITIAALALHGALLALLLLLLHHMVVRRLHRLALEIDALAAVGHAGSRVAVQGNDEITWLAQHLNDMLDTLDQCQTWQSKNELYLSQMLNSIQCGVMVVDARTRIISSINASGAAMVGLPPQDILGKACHRFLCPAEFHCCPVLDLGEEIDLSERILLRADGKKVPILKSVVTMERDGKRLLIESFIDISKLKQVEEGLKRSESKYHRFFEENLAGSCIWTVDSVILDCNPAFAHLLGYDTVEAAKEANMLEHCYFSNQKEDLLASLAGKKSVERLECMLRHKNGMPVHCIANIYTQFGSNGTIKELRGYFFDDTKRILLERQNHQLEKMDALGALASGLAHDINNILTSVKGNADFVCATAGKVLPAQAQRAMEDILKAGERAQGLTSQVLAFGRHQEKPAQPVLLAAMLEETLQILDATLPTNVRLEAYIQSQGAVLAGQNELHQVIMNLCVNAIQAMQAQGGILRIVLDEVDQPLPSPLLSEGSSAKRMLCLRIDDTGCGIAPHLVERIFDPFFTTKTKEVGSGLGLWLVKNHVSAMRGHISVQSEAGQGTSFILTFPLHQDPPNSIALETNPLPRGHERIAVIDDNLFVLEVCTAMLQRLGYYVHSFSEAEEALTVLTSGETPVNLLIVNNSMPDMDGFALVRHLRKNGFDCPIFLCLQKGDSVNLEEAGISGTLQKPVDMEQLAKSIRLTLDSGQAFADNA